MKKSISILVIFIGLILFGCASPRPDTVMQVSTIDALIAGNYDGHMTCSKLLEYGDFGLGTFQGLDGEMIVLEGKIYQVKADGRVYTPTLDTSSPFASLCSFRPEKNVKIEKGCDLKTLEIILEKEAPKKNLFCALRLDGEFKLMETRSVPDQKKPYPLLSEITKTLPKFKMKNVKGTIVGFRCPPFVKGLNVPGLHLHFLSDDKTQGGHILSFETINAKCSIDNLNQFYMVLPEDDKDFGNTDLLKDRSMDLKKIEN